MRVMLSGHPLILPTAHTSSFVAVRTATVTIAAPVPSGWTPTSSNLADPVNGPLAKGGPALVDLYQAYVAAQQPGATRSLATAMASDDRFVFSGNSIELELVDSGSESLTNFVSALEALGAQTVDISQAYGAVDAFVPVASLGTIAEMSAVQTMTPAVKPTTHITYDPGAGGPPMNVSGVTSLGDTGAGVTVGVLSDSVNNAGGLSTGIADGYLPSDVNVLQDEADGFGTDEGAAMLEEIHALAPGASLSFITAGDTDLQFAQNITALANSGAKILTDDVGFDDEPFFEPSVMDDSIAAAVAAGDIYFSAAGNAGNDGFREASNWVLQNGQYVFNWNDGSATTANSMTFTAAVNGGTELDLEWDNPWNGVTGNVVDNVQVTIIDNTTGQNISSESISNGFTGGVANTFATGSPIQSFFLPNDGSYTISATIQNAVGTAGTDGLATATTPLPDVLEFVTQDIGPTLSNFTILTNTPAPGTQVTTYGHSAGPDTIGVGAVDSAAPKVSEEFSAFGPAVYYFDSSGNRLTTPETVLNPFISAPDDVSEDVNYPQFYPFFGTSAATANAAAAGALLLSKFPSLTQTQMEDVLKATATPVNSQAQSTWNDQSGYGLINVLAAYQDLTTSPVLPEMDVSSGGEAISYGEISPSTLNNTEFGTASDAGGTITETYTITNASATGTLDLTTLTITPTSALTGFTIVPPTFSSTTLAPGQTATFEIEFTPTAVGTATAEVSIGSNDSLNPTPFVFEIAATGVAPAPMMEVEGNGKFISYNESTPSAQNDTYFGSCYEDGGTLFETFTIVNDSPTLPLSVTSVSVNPTPTSAVTGFTVIAGGGSVMLAVGQSSTFTIEFAPLSAGVATATVSITSNDASNPVPFLFEISATSLEAISSMEVEGANNQVIAYGAPPIAGNGTVFGPTYDNGASSTQVITLLSTGINLPLTIQNISVVAVAGSTIGGFSVTPAGSSSVAPGSSTTFTIDFTPTGAGVAYADIEIASSDTSNPSPFIFEVSGTGLNPPPTIVAQIDDSSPTGFSTTGTWNTYSAGLNGSEHYAAAGAGAAQADYTFTGLTPGQYEVLATWAPLPNASSNTPFTFYDGGKPAGATIANQSVAPNGSIIAGWQVIGLVNITSTTLRVAETNNANGLVIADGIEIGPLPGITLTRPELGVSDNLTGIASNATPEVPNGTDFGSTVVGLGSVIHTFTLTNNGLATLTLTGSSPVSTSSAGFSIVSQPAVSSLAPGASTTFQVRFTPTATGLQTGAIRIVSNDPNYPSAFELFVQGTGAAPTVLDDGQASFAGSWSTQSGGYGGSSHTAAAGSGTSVATYTFSGLAAGQYQVYATWPAGSGNASNAPFTLYNGGTSVGTIAENEKVAPSGPTYSGTSFQLLGVVNVTAGSLKVTLSNKANGTVVADAIIIVPVASNAAQAAQIGVTGDGASIAQSAAPQTANGTNFGGAVVATGSVTETFTISNTGGTTLTLTSGTPTTPIAVSGSGFTLVSQPAVDSLAPGASVTFQVKFVPTGTGLQTGTISIASNDPVNPTYTIDIEGTGISATSSQIAVSGNSNAIVPGATPELINDTNLGTTTVATGAVVETYTITNNGHSTLTLTGAKPVTVSGASFPAASVIQPGSDSLAPGASTTFQVTFTPTAVGVQSGTVSIASNDPLNGTFTFNVQGTGAAAPLPAPTIIDDSQTGFSLVGTWSTTKSGGFDGGEHYAAAGSGSSQAFYSFTGLAAGQYMVYATWSSFIPPSTPASNTPFTLYNGNTIVGSATVNQQVAPSGASFNNTAFQYIGTVTITSSLLRVALNNKANGTVLADAIAIVRVPSGDLSITKTDSLGGSSVTGAIGAGIPGDNVTYTITVANTGPGAANGALVNDIFPGISADTYTVAASAGAVDLTNPASGSGNIADTVDLPSGGKIIYTVTATINPADTGTLSNTATVTPPSTFFDANLADNTATDSDTLTPNVELTITKTDNVGGSSAPSTTGTALPGDPIIYTIVVANAGPSNAVGAVVNDPLATNSGFSGDTFTAVGTTGASGFTASGSGTIDDTVNLAAGSSITYTVTAAIPPGSLGTLSNTATVTAATGETLLAGSVTSATDTDTLKPTVGLTITKTDDDGGSSITGAIGITPPGTQIVYTIMVTNIGPSNAVGVLVADPLAANTDLTGDTFTASGTTGASGFTASGSGNIDDDVDLAANSSITYIVTANTKSSAFGTLTNFATVAAGSGETLASGSVTSATDKDNLVTPVLLTITKTDNDGGSSTGPIIGVAAPGSKITYTIVVTNSGIYNAVGANIADPLGANSDLTGVTFTAVGTTGATGFTAAGSGTIDDIVDLTVGSSITYTVTATIKSGVTGTLTNLATVAAGGNETLASGSVGSATDNDTLSPLVLTVTKTDNDGGSSITPSTGIVAPGSQITYTVIVTNSGASAAVGLAVADPLAGNADLTADTYTAVGTAGATGFTATGTGTIGDTVNMAAGSSITYTVTATISSTATGTLTNVATITPAAGESLGAGSVGSATDKDNLAPTVLLTISKTDNDGGSSVSNAVGTAASGAPITYTITVSNTGFSNAVGVLVSDPLATNSDISSDTFTAVGTAGATGFTASGSGTIHDTVSLAAGSSITYTVTANIKSGATGTLTNTSTVAAGPGEALAFGSVPSATDTDTLASPITLTVIKSDNDGGSSSPSTTGTVAPGSPVTYTITVTNTGAANAVGAVVNDPLASNADFSSDTFTAVGTTGATGFTASGTGTINDTVSMTAGSSITYTVTADTKAGATGTLSNTATLAAGSGEALGPGSIASATDKDNLVPSVLLTITKTDNDGGSSVTHTTGAAAPGSTITYTIVVTNFGFSNAAGVVISDPLASNTDLMSDSYSATGTAGASGFTLSGTGTIHDTVSLVAGSSITYTVTAVIKSSATGTLDNTSTVAAGPGETLGSGSITTATDADTL